MQRGLMRGRPTGKGLGWQAFIREESEHPSAEGSKGVGIMETVNALCCEKRYSRILVDKASCEVVCII